MSSGATPMAYFGSKFCAQERAYNDQKSGKTDIGIRIAYALCIQSKFLVVSGFGLRCPKVACSPNSVVGIQI